VDWHPELLRTVQEQTRPADAKGLEAGRWRARRDENEQMAS
jgi:hypothetical protein